MNQVVLRFNRKRKPCISYAIRALRLVNESHLGDKKIKGIERYTRLEDLLTDIYNWKCGQNSVE